MNKLTELSEEHAKRIEALRQRVIETIGNNMDLYGITMSIGHMYGHMYFNSEPVTLDEAELIERLRAEFAAEEVFEDEE